MEREGFKFLQEASVSLRQEKWKTVVDLTSCMCENCSHRVFDAAQDFILLAPYKERKFLTVPTLLADLSQMHADKRRKEILG